MVLALHYEPNCFTLVYRRLEQGKFIFPKNQLGHIEISQEHFKWLLASDKYASPTVMTKKGYENYLMLSETKQEFDMIPRWKST